MLKRGVLVEYKGDVQKRTLSSDAELRSASAVIGADIIAAKPLVLAGRERFAGAMAAMLEETARFHAANPLVAGMTREELRERVPQLRGAHETVFEAALGRLVKQGKLETSGETVRQAGRIVVLDDVR